MKLLKKSKQLWKRMTGLKNLLPIEVFVRHCHTSSASAHKTRFPNFSRERCYQNLIESIKEEEDVHITFFLDQASASQDKQTHFLKSQDRFPVIEIHAGTEALSFIKMLDYVLEQDIDPEAIIYFLEDDYLHKPDWIKVLKEGCDIENVDYITLFDHRDKYHLSKYPDLHSRIFHTKTCHWRTTPSTTNTYAMHFKTLKRDQETHRQFSLERSITADHEKFIALNKRGSVLISSIPGWATHVEPEFASPCTNWQSLLEALR